MVVHFHRLENALKRANEFIEVGKKNEALEILCDVLKSRKHRQWQKKHEDIMNKYLELCVELRRSYVAKEGIYQYKIICQQAYIKSFEDVVKSYLHMAEAKANSARELSQATVIDVDDLDNMQTPESILLSVVSSEDNQDRTDRVVLLPWVKFLWESYRQCLDLLKNNSRVERLYHDVAHQAFDFCIRYNRKTEFRKLCDNLHLHLDLLKKHQQQGLSGVQSINIVNLNNPESQGMHLETRLVQLDSAIHMELWQEAYKATDDIKKFGLMNLSKKMPKPQLMASYYQKLALVFWKANCPLFHASALFRLFNLTKELKKNITLEDLQKMASRVVLATLAIPIAPTRAEIDKLVDTEENVVENHQRNLASLLGLTATVPNRCSLIKDLKRSGILQFAYEPLQHLYNNLELDFSPLTICADVQKAIDFLMTTEHCTDLRQYINSLKDVTIIRLLKEISQVYQSIEYDRLHQLCPFADNVYLESMIVNAARRNDLQVRINHSKRCLFFGTGLKMSQGEEIIEGPHLQSMPSEQIRQQLVTMYSTLQRARAIIDSKFIEVESEQMKRKIMSDYKQNAVEEHAMILSRKRYVEDCKEQLKKIGLERQREEKKLLEERQQQLREAEEERMQKEAEERAKQKKEREEVELAKRMALDQIEKMKQTDVGLRLIDGLGEEELSKLRPEEIKSKQFEQLERERRDQIMKQRKIERKFDHLERAKRIEEVPLLMKQYDESKVSDEATWKEMEELRIKQAIEEREQALQHRERLKRMVDEKDNFVKQIKQTRYVEYLERVKQWESLLVEKRAKALETRKEKRKHERKMKWLEQKKEAELRRLKEIEKQKEEEEAKLAEIARKQEQREQEVQEKMRKKDEEMRAKRDEREKEDVREPVKEHTREVRNWRDGPKMLPPERAENEMRKAGNFKEERPRELDRRDMRGDRENRDRNNRDRDFNRDFEHKDMSRPKPRNIRDQRGDRDREPIKGRGDDFSKSDTDSWRNQNTENRNAPSRKNLPQRRFDAPPVDEVLNWRNKDANIKEGEWNMAKKKK